MTDTILRCEQIHKSYVLGRSELPVLRGVDLTVRRGQFMAITGASGSGKSTLLHVMSGLDVPHRGQVYYDGLPMFEPEGERRIPVGRSAQEGAAAQDGPAASHGRAAPGGGTAQEGRPGRREFPGAPAAVVRRGTRGAGAGGDDLRYMAGFRNRLLNTAFGFVFQFYHLLPEFDVLENVLLPQMVGESVGGWLANRSVVEKRARELLARVGLAGRLRHRPNELSGGERQRVAIARALINEPEALLADEPTGNLDRETGYGILKLFKELNGAGQTIVMVTHDQELASQADAVVQLVDGLVR